MSINNSASYIHVVSDVAIEGRNTQEAHATFLDLSKFTLDDTYVASGTTYRGSWIRDGGDVSAPAASRETRAYCNIGKARVTFTGTTVAIRLSLNSGWGTAKVLIDGVAPSTISGVAQAHDTVTCDATPYNSLGNEFIDYVVADNLAPGTHTLELLANNTNSSAFFVFSGVKSYNYDNATVSVKRWVASAADLPQPVTLKFAVRGVNKATQISANFNNKLVDATTKNPLGTVNLAGLAAGGSTSLAVLPNFTGSETTGSNPLTLSLSYLIADAAGTQSITSESQMSYDSPALTYTGTTWWVDPASDTLPEPRTAINDRRGWVTFNNTGDSFRIRLYRDYGLGTIKVYKSPVQFTGVKITSGTATVTLPNVTGVSVGQTVIVSNFAENVTVSSISGNVVTLSANATASTTSAIIAFGTYVTSFTCNETDAALQAKYANFTINGLGSAYSGKVLLRNTIANKAFAFNTIWATTTELYTSRTDTVTLNFNMVQVPPQPITDVKVENGVVKFTDVVKNSSSLVGSAPYDNRGVVATEVEYRFPTFVCSYTPGFLERFKEYDIVITDPSALTRAEVKQLQDLGIQVYMYVSFGEEDGQLSNIWDSSSAKGPMKGDGQGPGGYASYYMKGGYNFGEVSECSNDRQRMEGVKACAVNNANYYTSQGRCSKSCSKDWRTGYATWETGGACGGGFTRANNWKRTAGDACSNSTCSKYTPINNKCGQFSAASGCYGQDFSIMEGTMPDENGIWGSYYVNPVTRGPNSWFARLRDHYLPLVFNEPSLVEETLTVAEHVLTDGTTKVLGVQMTQAPFDESLAFSVTDVSTGFVYTPNVDYNFDKLTGAVIITVTASAEAGAPPAPSVGQTLNVKYYKRGLGADGVFMDTVDTVDIYPRDDYQTAAAGLINDLKKLYPSKGFCSNRGFSILDKIINSCSLVMTESVFSDYDFNAQTYQLVTNPDSVEYNNQVIREIQELRKSHTFDVVCLNYAPNDSSGDAIRAVVVKKTLELGWMPWTSTILLNDPMKNKRFDRGTGFVRQNEWKKIKVTNL